MSFWTFLLYFFLSKFIYTVIMSLTIATFQVIKQRKQNKNLEAFFDTIEKRGQENKKWN